MLVDLKRLARYRAWARGHPAFLLSQAFDRERNLRHGFTAWHRETDDDEVRIAAERAMRWLLSVQDPDGAFRRHFYGEFAATYSAHLACWLAEWGEYAADRAALAAAGRHLDWTLGHQ